MTGQYSILIATFVLVGAVAVPRLFPRWPLWASAAWGVTVLVLLTVLLQRLFGSPLLPRFHSDSPGQLLWEQLVEAGWWAVGAQGAIALVRLLIVLENRPRETQIISDLIAGAIYVAALLAIVNFAFAVPIGGLLATSGVIAIVLGLALQSTLSDVFSGIAVGIERPYKAGDLLWVEGGIEGHVIQVNWRSTHIATGNNNTAVVPNSVIAKARLVNHSLPTPIRGSTIEIKLDPRIAPERCSAVLHAATKACLLPLASPPAGVAFVGLHGDGASYEISFSVPSSEKLDAARTELLAKIQRHLRHAGIPLAVAGLAMVPELSVPSPAELLEQSDLFGVIAADERDLLAEHLTEVWLTIGETLIRQDEMPHSLFVIASGTVEITTTTPSRAHIVYRVSPGGCLGAVGLITDSPYGATATALTPVRAYSLDKDAIAAAISARPKLAAGLERLAKRGQAALSSDLVARDNSQPEHSEMFLSRMRTFLHKLASRNVPIMTETVPANEGQGSVFGSRHQRGQSILVENR